MSLENVKPEQNQGGDNGVADTAPIGAGAQDKPKVEFSPEQQAVVQTIIDRAFERAFNKGLTQGKTQAEKELEAKLAEAQTAIAKLSEAAKVSEVKAEEEAVPPPSKRGKASVDATQLQARLEELQSINTQLLSERDDARDKLTKFEKSQRASRIKDEFLEASGKINFFDPMEVFTLVRDHIDIDDELNAVVVKNPRTGQPRMNAKMEPMSIEEFLAEFAGTKPYLVRAANSDGGTGASSSRKVESRPRPEFDAARIATMTNEEFESYRNSILSAR